MRVFEKSGAALLAALLLGAAGAAPAAYPEQPLRVILPYAPGAAGDIIFRMIQPELSRELGQTVVIDYKTGAGGNIGTQMVARAKPDGYTLLFSATNNFVINQFLYMKMGYDPLKDLHVINKVADAAAFVYVNAQVPVKTMAQFRDYVQRHRGSAPGVQALIGNEVQMFIGGYGLGAAFLPEGKIRALAVALPERFPALPDVPTIDELGYKDVVVSNWWALAAPAGTDARILDQVEKALDKVLADPAIRDKLMAQGYVASSTPAARFRADLPAQARYWQDVVRKSGISIE